MRRRSDRPPRNVNRSSVPIEQIAPALREATIAAEDREFYSEGAINVKRRS